MKTFSALLAICAGNSPVPGEFPTQRPVTQSFDIFFDLRLNNGWVNNREVGDLRRYRTHYDVAVTVRHQANSKHHVDSTMTYIGTSSLRLKKKSHKKTQKMCHFSDTIFENHIYFTSSERPLCLSNHIGRCFFFTDVPGHRDCLSRSAMDPEPGSFSVNDSLVPCVLIPWNF